MAYLTSDLDSWNIPIFKVWVRQEFTAGMQKFEGQGISAIVIGIRTEPDRCLSFQLIFTGYEADSGEVENIFGGAMWAKMPIVALMADWADEPGERMPVNFAQPWDCSSYYHSVTSYSRCKPSHWECKIDGEMIPGRYYFTVDYCNSTVADDPSQHKQSHVIALTEGKYKGNIVALPNNRVRVHSPAYWDLGTQPPPFRPNPNIYCAEQDDSYRDPVKTFNNLYRQKNVHNKKK